MRLARHETFVLALLFADANLSPDNSSPPHESAPAQRRLTAVSLLTIGRLGCQKSDTNSTQHILDLRQLARIFNVTSGYSRGDYEYSRYFLVIRRVVEIFVALPLPLRLARPRVALVAHTGITEGSRKLMENQSRTTAQDERIAGSLPFVQALARRLAASMPHSIDIADLVQDGMIGLIDAASRFDEDRWIKFETFAERRVRGSMIDALRRGAWPRGIRKIRRELEAAREHLRHELGAEPSLSDLADHLGADEAHLSRTIVRINTIEATSPLATVDNVNEASLPPVLVPSEPPAPDKACEIGEVRRRVRAAIGALPPRERKVVSLYYFGEVTMKKIGEAIGVNESRVSQLHARAVQRLRKLLGPNLAPEQLSAALTKVTPLNMAKASLASASAGQRAGDSTRRRRRDKRAILMKSGPHAPRGWPRRGEIGSRHTTSRPAREGSRLADDVGGDL